MAAWQKLQMPMGLAGARRSATVEEPQARCIGLNVSQGLPIERAEPTRLRLPALRDQQDMPALHRELVEDEHVLIAEALHLQRWIPGQKWVGLWAGAAQVFWRFREQPAQHEGLAPRHSDDLRLQGNQSAATLGFLGTEQGCIQQPPLGARHQPEPCRSRASEAPR